MRRIGILTAGGDTPAINAAIHGAVVRANQLQIEIYGLIKGFNCLFNPRVPHVHLNPLFQEIPELDPTKGGSLIGASRDYIDAGNTAELDLIAGRLEALGIEGLIAIGGDGTLNGLQPLAERLPTVLAPKTIDNDLGLNYPSEPDEFMRVEDDGKPNYHYERSASHVAFDLNQIVNYATPGYATAVLVTAQGVERIRTTAESHRRIAIIEVMGRHSGYIALGTVYGQPDIILVPRSIRWTPSGSWNVSGTSTTSRRTWSSSAAKGSWTNGACSLARSRRQPTRRATWHSRAPRTRSGRR